MPQAQTIDQVIEQLDRIIQVSKDRQDPLGYFAALYRKVTIKVKEGIAEDYFDDGARMERLDVIFANRYLAAYDAHQSKTPVTQSWDKAFELATNYWPIVLQHLLIGMNAHINLDLGIAAAEVSKGKNIDDLQEDFNRINEILSSLVHGVQHDLTEVWPTLKILLKFAGQVDDWLVGFSMKLARDGAWKFATALAITSETLWPNFIAARDGKVRAKAKIVTKPGFVISTIFGLVRIGERGSVADRIENLFD